MSGYLRMMDALDQFRARNDHLPPSTAIPLQFELKEKPEPISVLARDKLKSIRCEQCMRVLKYGTRPCIQIDDHDAPPVYLCKYCKSGHEHKYSQEGISEVDAVRGNSRPPKRKCLSIVVSQNGRVTHVYIGCGETTGEWSEQGTRLLHHKEGCQAYLYQLRDVSRPNQNHQEKV